MVKIMPPVVKKMVKILSPAVKNGLIISKNVAEGSLPEKMHQGPPDS
jgi:hypothetical protein